MPGPRVINLRAKSAAAPAPPVVGTDAPVFSIGSNSFALAGGRTATGAALLANDMHLLLRVPNTWYRASLEWGDHKVTGVTLPGTPAVVVGSNGRIAWDSRIPTPTPQISSPFRSTSSTIRSTHPTTENGRRSRNAAKKFS